MLAEAQLKNLLNKSEFSNADKVLLCLAVQNASPKAVKAIKQVASDAGLRSVKNWNVSSLLSGTKGKAINTNVGWELSADGRTYVGGLVGPLAATPAPMIASSLRVHLSNIGNPDVRAFVEEGIECFEHRYFRSSVVLSWTGAVAVLYDHVIKNHLIAFNTAASTRFPKWKAASNHDELAIMGEADFLQVLQDISVIGKNVKQELNKQLTLRNGCGHPNTLKVSENVAAAHLEILILNVFKPYV